MAKRALLNLLLLALLVAGGYSSTIFYCLNKCPYKVWLGANPDIGETIFEYEQGTLDIFETPDEWSGSIWLRTGCVMDASLHFSCATGDCGSTQVMCNDPLPKYPVTLLNFDIKHLAVSYEVSLNHGYNVPIRIEPVSATGSCPVVECVRDLTEVCPADLVIKNSDGRTVACQSACDALKDPKYCCTGEYSSRKACKPNQYSEIFKRACPLAHTYPRDTNPPIYQCTDAAYNITFCPV